MSWTYPPPDAGLTDDDHSSTRQHAGPIKNKGNMKVDTYLTWKDVPPTVPAEWRAPVSDQPRRRGVMGALSALAARLRPEE